MPSKKELREYGEKYGDISNDLSERLVFLFDYLKINLKNITNIKNTIKKHKKAKWHEINLVIYFVPKATPRARYSGFTKKFYVSDAKNNSDIMKAFVKQNMKEFPLITTPCEFHCTTYSPTPINAMSKEEIILSELQYINLLAKPDWDNLGKTYSDMIQEHLILDDSNITFASVRKLYSIKPRIEVKIRFMEKYDCKYNMKKVKNRKQYKDRIDRIIDTDYI